MHPHVVLFDLDGTLTESGPGIMRSVAFALEAVGAPALEPDALVRFLGPPLAESFREIATLDDAEIEVALAAFAQYFHRRGMFENSVYPGVSELLHALNGAGRRLGVATSKPTPSALAVLEHFSLTGHFDAICGAVSDGVRATKAEVLADALAALEVEAGRHVVLVGDRSHDVIGAHTVGIECVGVAWGYGTRDELVAAGADTVVMDVEELAVLLGVTLPRVTSPGQAGDEAGDEAFA